MLKQIAFIYLFIISSLTLFTGCGNQEFGNINLSESTMTSPIASNSSGNKGTPILAEVVQPTDGSGSVVAMLSSQLNSQPYANQSIYLATMKPVEDTEGKHIGSFAVLDINNDPKAESDANGVIIFENVLPGKYVLAVRLPNLKEVLLTSIETSGNVLVEVTANEINDLGMLTISE